jgi:hypothetical protein
VTCSDNANACQTTATGKPKGSRLKFAVNAGETYFIVVDGANGAAGDFVLTVEHSSVNTARNATTAPAFAPETIAAASAPDGETDADVERAASVDAHDTTSPGTIYRCRRTRNARELTRSASPGSFHLSDRFGDLVGRLRSAHGICEPVTPADSELSAAAPLVRHGVRIERFVAVPPTTIRLANVLGELEVKLEKPDVVQVALEPPSAAPSEPGAPQACYRVRSTSDESQHRALLLGGPENPEEYEVSEPARFCAAPGVDAEDSVAGHLCYRARHRDSAASETRFVEVCLSSYVVPDDAP